MIYSTQQKGSIIYQAQVWLADQGTKLEALERSMQPCDDLYFEAYRVRTSIAAIQRGYIDDLQAENIYTCLVKIAGIKDYPVGVPIEVGKQPDILFGSPGPAGPAGAAGTNGTNALIDVLSTIESIRIVESVDPLDPNKKIFTLEDNTYVAASVALALSPAPASVIEIGNVLNFDLNITLTKGRDDVISSAIEVPAALDTAYQTNLDLAGLNAGGPKLRIVSVAGVIASGTYTVNINDNTTTNKATKTVTFAFPFFYGSNNAGTIDPYVDLTYLLQVKGTKVVPFNGNNEYFYFAYPASYGLLKNIKDQNNFELLQAADPAFIKVDQDVTSQGLTNDWTTPYFVYRTKAKTSINGNYTFIF